MEESVKEGNKFPARKPSNHKELSDEKVEQFADIYKDNKSNLLGTKQNTSKLSAKYVVREFHNVENCRSGHDSSLIHKRKNSLKLNRQFNRVECKSTQDTYSSSRKVFQSSCDNNKRETSWASGKRNSFTDYTSKASNQIVRRKMLPRTVFSAPRINSLHASENKVNSKEIDFVKELINKESDEIILTILRDKRDFLMLLEQDTERDLIAYFLIVLRKALSSYMSKHNSMILNRITSSGKFLKSISKYLTSFQLKSSESFHLESIFCLIRILSEFQVCLPSSASDVLLTLLPLLRKTCQMYLSESPEYAAALADLDEIERQNTLFLEKYSPTVVKNISWKEKMQLQEPPENYRSVPILPTVEDFSQSSAFIRPNVVKGRYQDTEHYLDVQFRLLREDYVKPLRDGINEYLNLKKIGKSTKQCKDVRVYEGVHIISQQFVVAGLVHIVEFNAETFARINWEKSKRFLTDSLLCFSDDYFKTVYFATVAERKPEELKNGKLMIRFEELTDEVLSISVSTEFVVIETTAYFESYRHNLKALMELNERRLPMKRYIVEVEKTVFKPEYLSYDTFYDMRPLMIPLDKKYIDIEEPDIYNFPPDFHDGYKSVRVLDESSWPSHTDLNLNPNQYAALKAAITKEFAVIQGPPGTGKTFIGLRIVQLILHNLNKWTRKPGSLPVLIVCQTNHALDQFLEGISMFTQSIVRIGGGSKNEALLKFKLTELKKIMRSRKNTLECIHSEIQNERNILKKLRSEIEKKNDLLEKSRHLVLTKYEIREYVSDIHFDSLTRLHKNWYKDIISGWLNVREEDYEVSYEDEEIVETDLWLDMNNREFSDIKCMSDSEIPENRRILMNCDNYKREVTNYISIILRNIDFFESKEENCIKNVWEMDAYCRWKLYKTWLRRFIENLKKEKLAVVEKLSHQSISNNEKENLTEYLQSINKFLRSSYSCVFNEYILKNNINPSHFKSLRRSKLRAGIDFSVMYIWLELKCKNQSEIKCRIEVLEKLEAFDQYLRNIAGNGEYEDDIKFIEAQRNFDEEEFAGASYNFRENNGKDWKKQHRKKSLKKHIEKNFSACKTMSEIEANRIKDVWQLSFIKRWQLYKFWLQNLYEGEKLKKYEKLRIFREKYKSFCELRSLEDIHVCRNAQVIGMTTTGAAKYKHIIQPLRPVILIVEEAAEILESHLVTSLTPNTQHVILIGDHQQLKPNPTVYMLSTKYDLDVSLFERMVKNGLPNFQLRIQHRMRPEISALLVPHIYAQLENHDSVHLYENIKGVNKNVFFISHNHKELQESDSKSKINRHEAQFLIMLCKYFIRQNYDPSQITILTTYTGQLFELKKCASGIIDGVRFAAVDNYQGEENDIILISFVRSNEDGEIGFLKISNRICVALSRAKKGLYCIGNFLLLAEKSGLWKEITNILREKNAIGNTLELVCQNHPDTINVVSNAENFDSVPDGGCNLKCIYRMPCGHECPLMCHPFDKEHENIKCYKPCSRTCTEGHWCKKICYEECGPCKVEISKIIEICNHEISVACHLKNEATCTVPCESVLPCEHICTGTCGSCEQGKAHIVCKQECKRTLKCGHKCQSLCNEICGICKILVMEKLEKCGHEIKIKCYRKGRVITCTEECKKLLPCGHETITKCYLDVKDVKCMSPCEKFLNCGHLCSNKCGNPCAWKCYETCSITSAFCGHTIQTKCFRANDGEYLTKICTSPCKAKLPCKHVCKGSCNTCHQGRFHIPCFQKCKQVLICGHQCNSICSKICGQCKRACENWCPHRKCSKKCNEICKPCIEPCTWVCPHKKCNRLCWQLCDRTPCDEPCSKLLDCQHPCMGFCGEPCPMICRVCNEINGTEAATEPNARYVILEDCNHIYEVNDITQWMNSTVSKNGPAKPIACPKCGTVVRRNCRFGNIVKSCSKNVEEAKKCLHKENAELRLQIIEKLKSSDDLFNNLDSETRAYKRCIEKVLNSKKHRTLQELIAIVNCSVLMNTYASANTLIKKHECNRLYKKTAYELISNLKTYVASVNIWMLKFLQNCYLTASKQQLHELGWEIHRLKIISHLLQHCPFCKDEWDIYCKPSDLLEQEISQEAAFTWSTNWSKLMNSVLTYSPFREQDCDAFCSELKKYSDAAKIEFNVDELKLKKDFIVFYDQICF